MILEYKSNFYDNIVLLDVDFDKSEEISLELIFWPVLDHLRGPEGPKRVKIYIFELESKFSVTKVLMDADYNKNN